MHVLPHSPPRKTPNHGGSGGAYVLNAAFTGAYCDRMWLCSVSSRSDTSRVTGVSLCDSQYGSTSVGSRSRPKKGFSGPATITELTSRDCGCRIIVLGLEFLRTK
jgi:hypothetical protein